MKAHWLWPLSLVLFGTAVPISACSSNQNHAERESAPEAVLANAPMPDQKAACIGTCLPDPGSKAVDCEEQLAGYQYEWAWDLLSANNSLATYTYDDNTPKVLVPERPGWQPAGDDVSVCGMTKAVRFRGGPFIEYGGGFGTSFITAAAGNDRSRMPNLPPSAEFPDNPEDGPSGAYDLSGWEGIAIWVRRGPNGQATLRAGMTERNSAEDLNTSVLVTENGQPTVKFAEREGRYCQRYRVCGCAPETPCMSDPEVPNSKTYCWDYSKGKLPIQDSFGHVFVPLECGDDRCKALNTSLVGPKDAKFDGRSCELATTSDGLSGEYCFNPGTDPNPPAKRERCGNPFSRPINVTMDWQLIRVPFSELRQADEADVALEMDLKSVKQLVFTHTTGWIDFWVANIGFYRKPVQ